MKNNRWIIILVILSVIGTGILYPSLPEQVPAQWNGRGEVSRYHDKVWTFATALLPLGLFLLMKYLPHIDPKKASYEKHKKAYTITQLLIVLVMVAIHWLSMAASLGYDINVGAIVRIIIGILFVVLGNYMGQIRQNYFFGIRTPWTLANEEVWKKTHRVGAYSFIITGIIMILTLFVPGKAAGVIIAMGGLIGVGLTYVYSYLTFKKITK